MATVTALPKAAAVLAVGLMLWFAALPVQAATRWWDGNDTSADADGGNGTWDNDTTANWDDAATGGTSLTWSNVNNDVAVFLGTAGTVTLGGAITVGGLQFDTAGYVITANTLTLAGTATVTANADATIQSIIAGASGLTKAGAGTLTLSGANTYTGTTFINAGTLEVGINDGVGTGALGNGGNITFGGGTLKYASGITQDYSSRIVNSTSAIIVDTNGGTITWATDLAASNTGGLTKKGAGTLTVEWDGDYTGTTTVDAGTLVLANDVTNADSGSTNFQINNGSTLVLDGTTNQINSNNNTYNFGSAGGGTLTVNGNSIWQNGAGGNTIVTTGGTKNTVGGSARINLQNTNTITYNVADGTDAVDLEVALWHERGSIVKNGAGTLLLSNPTNSLIKDTNTITINNGTLEVGNGGQIDTSAGPNGDWQGAVILTNAGSIFKHSSSLTQTLSGVISGAGSVVVDNGSSSLTLSGANTYSGSTTLSGGTLRYASTNSMSAASTVNVQDGTTLGVNLGGTGEWTTGTSGNGTLGGLLDGTGGRGNTVNYTGNVTLEFNTANAASAQTYAAVIANVATTLGITKIGSGTLELTGANTYTGATTVNGGTLQLGNGGASGALSTSSAISIGSGATFAINQTDTVTQGTDFSGAAISGAGGFGQFGSGTTILNVANDYSGTTFIDAGTLEAGHASALGTGNIDFGGGILKYTAASAGTDWSTRIVNSSSPIKIDTNGQNITFGSAIPNSNSGGLTKLGTGTLSTKMGPSYSGTTTIEGGTLQFVNVADLTGITSTAFNINNGSTLEIQSSLAGSNRTVLNNKTFTFDSNGGGTINFNNGSHLFQNAALYTHNFVTTGGSKNTISSSNGGFMNMQTVGEVTFTVADGTDARDLELSATFTNGLIKKEGAGTLAITGTHNGSYAIDINAGTLEVGDSAGLNGGTFTAAITNDGTFKHTSDQVQTISGAITGSGSLEKINGSALTLSGNNSYNGTTTIGDSLGTDDSVLVAGSTTGLSSSSAFTINSDGVLKLNNFSNTIGSLAGAGTVRNADSGSTAATLTTGGDNSNTTFSGILQDGGGGALSLTKTGSGTQTLSGANTYTGATTVSAGRLTAGSGSAFGNNSAVTVASSAFLELDGNSNAIGSLAGAGTVENASGSAATLTTGGDNSSTTFSGILQDGTGGGTFALTKTGSGTQTLSGANTYTGLTTISNGALRLGDGGAGGSLATSSTISVGSGATFIINQSDTVTQGTDFSGAAVSGAGGFTQAGSGTTVLNAANSYAGQTTVENGTLQINGSHSGSGAYVVNGGTLSGSANISGHNVTVNSGGTLSGSLTTGTLDLYGILSPGNSPGTLTNIGNVAWFNGGEYVWEIDDADGSAGLDHGWDLNFITGTLDLSALTDGGFTIDIDSLLTANHLPGAPDGSWGGLNSTNQFKIVDAATITGFQATDFTLDAGGFISPVAGIRWTWTIYEDVVNHDIYLQAVGGYVPESSVVMLLACGGWVIYRRHKSHQKAATPTT